MVNLLVMLLFIECRHLRKRFDLIVHRYKVFCQLSNCFGHFEVFTGEKPLESLHKLNFKKKLQKALHQSNALINISYATLSTNQNEREQGRSTEPNTKYFCGQLS